MCGDRLDPSQHDPGVHPACEDQQAHQNDLANGLRADLMQMIHWANDNSPRSLQATIGPSELGSPCDRKIAYQLAGVPEVNLRRDPWPAIVGTSVHHWLEDAVNQYQQHHGDAQYVTEQELAIDALVIGHTDLYRRNGVVIDYKTCNPDLLKKFRLHGPPLGYRIQCQLYGKGHADAGRPVTDVALVFLPRTGWLSDMYVWTSKFMPEIAQQALDRMYAIGHGLIAADVASNPEVYDKIPAAADHCGYCPWFLREKNLDGATDKGCPGV